MIIYTSITLLCLAFHGGVESVKIVKNRLGHPVFAFVEMKDSQDAQFAINELDYSMWKGNLIVVKEGTFSNINHYEYHQGVAGA